MHSPFSRRQLHSFEIVERTTSVISLIASLFIITTFLLHPSFRKPINRLVVYASLGNVLCNVATIISISGVKYGEENALCKLQGFLIQMFIPADSLWAFCMAFNVYLTFFKNYNSHMLRRLEKWYFIFCYGIPFTPAFVYLIIDIVDKKGIYGNANLWCWISTKYDWMRIAFFYGPVWVVIALTTAIYLRTGKDIFKQRAALRAFHRDNSDSFRVLHNPFNTPPVGVTKITEIRVTRETINPSQPIGGAPKKFSETESRSSFASTRNLSTHGISKADPPPNHLTRQSNQSWPRITETSSDKGHIHDTDAGTKCTTTVTAGITLPLQIEDEDESCSQNAPSDSRKRRHATLRANTAAWGYAKVALLMFVALFIVWVPATINRIYQVIHQDKPIFALNFIAALVLPLQGFWNCMVYISTSWPQCKVLYREMIGSRLERRRGSRIDDPHSHHFNSQNIIGHRRNGGGGSQDLSSQEAYDMDPTLDEYDLEVDTERMQISTTPRHREAEATSAISSQGNTHTRPTSTEALSP